MKKNTFFFVGAIILGNIFCAAILYHLFCPPPKIVEKPPVALKKNSLFNVGKKSFTGNRAVLDGVSSPLFSASEINIELVSGNPEKFVNAAQYGEFIPQKIKNFEAENLRFSLFGYPVEAGKIILKNIDFQLFMKLVFSPGNFSFGQWLDLFKSLSEADINSLSSPTGAITIKSASYQRENGDFSFNASELKPGWGLMSLAGFVYSPKNLSLDLRASGNVNFNNGAGFSFQAELSAPRQLGCHWVDMDISLSREGKLKSVAVRDFNLDDFGLMASISPAWKRNIASVFAGADDKSRKNLDMFLNNNGLLLETDGEQIFLDQRKGEKAKPTPDICPDMFSRKNK